MTDSEKTVVFDHRHASNSVAFPQLSDGVVIKFSPQDVTEIFRVVMDADREAAFALVHGTIYRAIRAVLDRPHCSPVFEMNRKLRENG